MNAAYVAKLTSEISPVHHSKVSPSKISHCAYAHVLLWRDFDGQEYMYKLILAHTISM